MKGRFGSIQNTLDCEIEMSLFSFPFNLFKGESRARLVLQLCLLYWFSVWRGWKWSIVWDQFSGLPLGKTISCMVFPVVLLVWFGFLHCLEVVCVF